MIPSLWPQTRYHPSCFLALHHNSTFFSSCFFFFNLQQLYDAEDPDYNEPVKISQDSKWGMTLLLAGSASGVLLPPFFIYKAESIGQSWVRDAPTGSNFAATPSGWNNTELTLKVFKMCILPYFNSLDNDKTRVLLLDGFS